MMEMPTKAPISRMKTMRCFETETDAPHQELYSLFMAHRELCIIQKTVATLSEIHPQFKLSLTQKHN
jgi:hypothetical protein